jgi:hypothetical protein
MDQARLIARRLAATGKPLSRRALRSGGVKDSNESLNRLAREVSERLTYRPDVQERSPMVRVRTGQRITRHRPAWWPTARVS